MCNALRIVNTDPNLLQSHIRPSCRQNWTYRYRGTLHKNKYTCISSHIVFGLLRIQGTKKKKQIVDIIDVAWKCIEQPCIQTSQTYPCSPSQKPADLPWSRDFKGSRRGFIGNSTSHNSSPGPDDWESIGGSQRVGNARHQSRILELHTVLATWVNVFLFHSRMPRYVGAISRLVTPL